MYKRQVSDDDYEICEIDLELEEFELSREIDNTPFVPKDEEKLSLIHISV